MFLSNHAISGALIGIFITNPILAAILGFFSHFLLDIIPHGDSKLIEEPKKKILLIAGIDFMFITGVGIVTLIFIPHLITVSIFLGAFFAMVPDALQLPYFISKKKYFNRYKKIHQAIHDCIAKKYELPLYGGVLFQIILFVLMGIIVLSV
jgi:hypothetical protein